MSDHTRPRLLPVERLTKVTFELDVSDWHDHTNETLWAAFITDKTYALRNVPFFIYGVSFNDVVVGEPEDGQIVFRRVYRRGGHSTYRIFLVGEESERRFEEAWEPLRKIGCTYERATDYLVAMDVPPHTDIYEAYADLEKGLSLGVWDFEEAHCGHQLRS